MTDGNTLFEIDRELDSMLDQIEEEAEENGTASPELLERFRQFCEAESEKVDRIGRFLTFDGRPAEILPAASRTLSETRAHHRNKDSAIRRTWCSISSGTRMSKRSKARNSRCAYRRTVRTRCEITDEAALPKCYWSIEARIPGVIWEMALSLLPEELTKNLESFIQETRPDSDAIRDCSRIRNEVVPGAEVRRGFHLRVA